MAQHARSYSPATSPPTLAAFEAETARPGAYRFVRFRPPRSGPPLGPPVPGRGPTSGSTARSSSCSETCCHDGPGRARRRPQAFEDDPATTVVPEPPPEEEPVSAAGPAPPGGGTAGPMPGGLATQPAEPAAASASGFGWGGLLVSTLTGLVLIAAGLWFTSFVAVAVARDDWIGWVAAALLLAALSAAVLLGRELLGLLRSPASRACAAMPRPRCRRRTGRWRRRRSAVSRRCSRLSAPSNGTWSASARRSVTCAGPAS